jgi:hypothetical protein
VGCHRKIVKPFLDHKKMPQPAAPVAQEPHRGKHHRANPLDDDEQIGEINVIFGDNMSIASKTQGKKFIGRSAWLSALSPEER